MSILGVYIHSGPSLCGLAPICACAAQPQWGVVDRKAPDALWDGQGLTDGLSEKRDDWNDHTLLEAGERRGRFPVLISLINDSLLPIPCPRKIGYSLSQINPRYKPS